MTMMFQGADPDLRRENAELREENRELGETIEFQFKRLETLESGGEVSESLPAKDKSKQHRTTTRGVTYRETKDGNHYYVLHWDPEAGKQKREAVGYSYAEAVEIKRKFNEQRKAELKEIEEIGQ